MMKIIITGGSGFIGTNLIDELLATGANFINIDTKKPKKKSHIPYWRECDILDFDCTKRVFQEFQPTHIVHLAARTDTLSSNLDDYRVNTDGTENILNAIKVTPSSQKFINTSSQFVFAPPGLPSNDEEYNPIGAYGKSKVIAEKTIRNSELDCAWTIVRPTNIWGPWHPRYHKEFWLVLKKGLYIHPDVKPTIRSYGYVKNVVYQIMKILEAPLSLIKKQTYYLGDPPIRLLEWVNGFSYGLRGKPVFIVPRFVVKLIAVFGSCLNVVGVTFPITLSRYRSMTEDYFCPIEPTIASFGTPPYSLDKGIKETIEWLNYYWKSTNRDLL